MRQSALSLPVEVLLEIFKHASQGGDVDEDAKTVFRLSGVCFQWLSILLDYAPIWSALSFAGPDVTELMLQRSKAAPLFIHVDLRSSNNRWVGQDSKLACNVLHRALERTRELVIMDGGHLRYNSDILGKLGHAQCSLLTTLELISPNPSKHPAYRITPAHLAGAVHLRYLTLEDAELLDGVGELLPGLCSSLAHLSLRKVRGLSLAALLAVLAASRGTLRTLELEELRLNVQQEITLTDQLDLLSLEELSFHCVEALFSTSPVAILPYITHPTATRFTAHICATESTFYALSAQSALCTHLASLGYNFGSAVLGSANIFDHSGLRLRCWPSRVTPDVYNLDQRSPATLDLRVTITESTPDSVRNIGSMLAVLAKSANIASVRGAAMACADMTPNLDEVLEEAVDLIALSVYGPHNLRTLANALSFKKKVELDDSSPSHLLLGHSTLLTPPLPFAKLTSLNVFELDLDGPPESCDDKYTLIKLLKALPHPPDELCICYSDMRVFDRLDIAPFVMHGHIVWDGCEQGRQNVPVHEDIIAKAKLQRILTSAPVLASAPATPPEADMAHFLQNILPAGAEMDTVDPEEDGDFFGDISDGSEDGFNTVAMPWA